MFYRRIVTAVATIALALSATAAAFANGSTGTINGDKKNATKKNRRRLRNR